jgi:subtilisin family serine protease
MRPSSRWAPAAVLLLIPLLCGSVAAADTGRNSGPGNDPGPGPGQSLVPVERSNRAVPDQYIVTLKPSLSTTTALRQLGLTPLFTYEKVLRGFAVVLTPSQLNYVRAFPGIEAVEENSTVTVDPSEVASRLGARTGPGGAAGPDRTRPTPARVRAESWGLDRIDQRTLPLDNEFTVTGTGRGVTAYIVDTGIETANSEFGGRATNGFDVIGDGRNGQDCNGHGTHVAGTTGGANYGVARGSSLVGVRVLDCQGSGTTAGVVAGFDWVAKNATQPAVLNASLGGSASTAVDTAVNSVSDAGVLPVVAAGNEAQDACAVSPARAEGALAVGATDRRDGQTDFSNFGECLAIYAPGADIVSAKLGGGSIAHSGTSMASPHVTGVAALYKERNPGATPGNIAGWLASEATEDTISRLGPGSPDLLLYTGRL